MLDLVALALLVGDEDSLAAVVGQQRRAVVERAEILGGKLAAVDQRKGQAVGEERAELLHQIEREAWPAGAVGVQVADGRIEADGFERARGHPSSASA